MLYQSDSKDNIPFVRALLILTLIILVTFLIIVGYDKVHNPQTQKTYDYNEFASQVAFSDLPEELCYNLAPELEYAMLSEEFFWDNTTNPTLFVVAIQTHDLEVNKAFVVSYENVTPYSVLKYTYGECFSIPYNE